MQHPPGFEPCIAAQQISLVIHRVAVVHVGVADAQAVDCFATLMAKGAVPPSDLDVVIIENPLSEAKKGSVASERRFRGQTHWISRL